MAASYIRCTVVEIHPYKAAKSGCRQTRTFDLLPWADPYIAGLVRKLERSSRSIGQRACLVCTAHDGKHRPGCPESAPPADRRSGSRHIPRRGGRWQPGGSSDDDD